MRMNAWGKPAATLLLATAVGCSSGSGGAQDGVLRFRTPDGFTILAELALPAEGDSGPAPPLVLLCHGLDATRRAWDPLVPHLVAQGVAAVAVDLRGFGESTAQAAAPAHLDAAARTNLHLDLLGALDAVGGEGRADTSRVIIVAEALSITPAVRAAIERSSVRGLVLIAGLIEQAEEEFLRDHPGLPVLLIASGGDRRGRNLMRQYAVRLTGPEQDYVELPAGEAPGWRGADGLAGDSGLVDHILWFVERTFVERSASR